MYGSKVRDELSQETLDEARRGFMQLLRKRFSAQFIANHGEEMFAKAALEYSRKISEGAEIETPVGWLITCAWRRTGGLLEAQSRTPDMVSADLTASLTDDLGQSPEQVALEEDRFHKVHEAVDQLSREERQLLELSYFEGMAVREAARELHWHPSKAQRCHEAARRRLHELLGVSSSDDLQIEIGLAAYVSLAAEASTGGRITGLFQRAGQKSAEGLASLKQQAAATYYPRGRPDASRRCAAGHRRGAPGQLRDDRGRRRHLLRPERRRSAGRGERPDLRRRGIQDRGCRKHPAARNDGGRSSRTRTDPARR